MKDWRVSDSLNHGENTRPHPGPLAQGEGEVRRAAWKLEWLGRHRRCITIRFAKRSTTDDDRFGKNRRIILPLTGERAGERADVNRYFKELFS